MGEIGENGVFLCNLIVFEIDGNFGFFFGNFILDEIEVVAVELGGVYINLYI